MLGIDREISKAFGLEAKNIIPHKDAFMVVTAQGRKVLKKMPFSPERVRFIHGAKEHLAGSGFTGVDRYICTLDGEPYFNFDNSCYTLVDFINGRECNFDNDSDLRQAAMTLAMLHKASRGYRAPAGSIEQNELGKLPGYFNKRLEDIKKLKKQAKKGKGRFDHMFLEHVDYFYEIGELAAEELEMSGYGKLAESTGAEGLFCHHDYTHHNIIMEEAKISVINFDYCCLELKVYDIANLIRRKMRKCDWDITKTELIIHSYSSVEPLSNEELEIIRIIIQFPQKFWRVVNRYYNSKRSWSERSFVERLREVIVEIEPHKEFIRSFKSLYGSQLLL